MRLFFPICALVAVSALLSNCQAPSGNYIGMTRRQLISRLGVPAAIDLYQRKPATEYWVYYQRTPAGGIEAKYFAFSANGRVETHYADVNPHLFLSSDDPGQRLEILGYRRSHLKDIDYDRL